MFSCSSAVLQKKSFRYFVEIYREFIPNGKLGLNTFFVLLRF